MVDILYFGTKAVIVLGTYRGVLVAAVCTVLLGVLAVGAYFGSTIPVFLLLLVYTMHCALSVSGAAMAVVNLSIGMPVWIFVYRLALAPFEAAMVISVVGSEK
jgi:hypothetical protein